MGVNKILRFAGDATNILSDADYNSSPERTGGNTVNSVANSALANKVLKQASAIAYAVGEIIAQTNSFDADDAQPSNLALGLQNAFLSLNRATNIISLSGATWSLTFPTALDLTKPQIILFITQVSSVNNQVLRINNVSHTLKYYNGKNVNAELLASSASPFAAVCLVYNGSAYLLHDVSSTFVDNVNNHIASTSNPHSVTPAQIGAATATALSSLSSTVNGLSTTVGGKANKSTSLSFTLATSAWSFDSGLKEYVAIKTGLNTGTVNANNNLIVSPAPASFREYTRCEIYCYSVSSGSMTLRAKKLPSATTTVQVFNVTPE